MIEITGVDLKRFAKKVFQLSEPTERHSSVDPMSDTSMGIVLKTAGIRNWRKYVLDMHIVQGRACNMTVFENDQGRWFIQDTWYGHTEEQLRELLEHCGVTPPGGNNKAAKPASLSSAADTTSDSVAGNAESQPAEHSGSDKSFIQ
jgi:hypothetical protein